uniref:Uncharacterized protein n=1 Tax=Arundo donax TaxID=35708 RepID=A0A0A8ZX57_ARUDO
MPLLHLLVRLMNCQLYTVGFIVWCTLPSKYEPFLT